MKEKGGKENGLDLAIDNLGSIAKLLGEDTEYDENAEGITVPERGLYQKKDWCGNDNMVFYRFQRKKVTETATEYYDGNIPNQMGPLWDYMRAQCNNEVYLTPK